MAYDLEKLAQGRETVFTSSEVVCCAYDTVRGMPFEAAVAHLRSSLSAAALDSVRLAAEQVAQKIGPDIESFGVAYITVEAPVHIDHANDVPMAFVHYLISDLVPTRRA